MNKVGTLCLFLILILALPVSAQTQSAIRVNAGGSGFSDSSGHLWGADFGYNNGQLAGSAPSANVTGTSNPILFKSARYSLSTNPELQYQFSLANGSYKVNLYFAETYFKAVNKRVFDVQVQGSTLFPSLDIFAAVGANYALVKSAVVSVTNGKIVIRFVHHPNADNPIISGIEIIPAGSAAPTIVTQPANVTIAAGQAAKFTVTVSGTTPLSYQWQKNGTNISGATSSSYTTPVTSTGDSGETFCVRVSNSAGSILSNSADLTVKSSATIPLSITTTSLASTTQGTPYFATLAASGGTTPYSWSLSSGSLPAGLTLNSSGQISGAPSAVGSDSLTIEVTDSSSPAQTAKANFTITISTAGGGGATLVICPNLGQVGNKANCAPSPTLAFGKQGTNTTSAALGVSVNNCSTAAISACSGSGTLTLGSPYFTLSGANASDFTVVGTGSCTNGDVLASGSSCTLVLRFTPTQPAGTNETATLTVSGNGANGSQTLNLTGTSATVTQVSGCQALSGSTNYQLISNVAASGNCFTVGQSNTDINLNGFTVTYCNSSSSSFVGGVLMNAYGVHSTTVHNGTISEGSGNCSGLVGAGYGSGAVVASSGGSSSDSEGTTLFNLHITVGTNIGSAKVLFEENGGSGNGLSTVVHDVIYTDHDTKNCGGVGCRDQDQGYPVVIDQSGHASGTQFYNVVGTGGTQGGVVTTAPDSNLSNNIISPGNATATLSNGFAFQDWGTNATIQNNLIVGSGPGSSCLSCRGVQVSSVNGQAVTGTMVENNVLYTSSLANDAEYGGCQIDGSYGLQINTAGASQDLSNNTFQNNKVFVTSGVCPGFGFSWSGATAANGPNNTKSNTFSCSLASGYTTGPCAGIRLDANQYNPGISAVVGTGDTYIGDTSAIYIWYDGTPTWTCKQCTFGKGSNPISNWVMLDYDGGFQSGQSSQPMHLIDSHFINGATKDSNNLASWASNNSSLSFSYVVQWSYTVTVKGASGNVIVGASVTATDALGHQECSGVTNSSGTLSCTLTDTTYGAASGKYTVTSSNPFSVSISATGCSTANNSRTILSTTSETVALPGC